MSAVSAAFLDEGVGHVGAVISGRRTYDLSEAWGGRGPMPGVPLLVLTHQVPDAVPAGEPPYTFVTDGIQRAVGAAVRGTRDRGDVRPRPGCSDSGGSP
jgi:dihydrofolate reductase